MKTQSMFKALIFSWVALFIATTFAGSKEVGNATNFKNYTGTGMLYKSTDEIVLTADITPSGSVTVGKNLKIRSKDGNVYKLTMGDTHKFTIDAGYTLTLENVIIDGAPKTTTTRKHDMFTLKSSTTTNSVSKLILGNGAVIQNVAIGTQITSGNKAPIYVQKNAVLEMLDGSSIVNCKNGYSDGGAIYCDSGEVFIRGGTIANCQAKGHGGAIFTMGTRVANDDNKKLNTRGDLYLFGGSITNNRCGASANTSAYGGGVYLGGSGPMLYVSGSVLVSNNLCKANNSTVSDDISTYLLQSEYTNRLKLDLPANAKEEDFQNAWIGVRYPDAKNLKSEDEVQDVRFASVFAASDANEVAMKQFFWNGNSENSEQPYRGAEDEGNLVWSSRKIYVLPRDEAKIADVIREAGKNPGSFIYIELADDYEVKNPENLEIINNFTMIVELNGHKFNPQFTVQPGGKVIFRDSSADRTGRVAGKNSGITGYDLNDKRFSDIFLLEGGSYQERPLDSWLAKGFVSIKNYNKEFPWTVSQLAWQATREARIADATGVALELADTEIRDVEVYSNGDNNIDLITYSTGDWEHLAYTNQNLFVEVLAVPAYKDADGSLHESGRRVRLFASDNRVANSSTAGKYSSEDVFTWEEASKCYGLIKLIHISKELRPDGSTPTNDIQYAYFQFRDPSFIATQRVVDNEKGDKMIMPIFVVEAFLEEMGYNRLKGYEEKDVNASLHELEPNGLRRWENLVTGTETNKLLVTAAETVDNGAAVNIGLTEDTTLNMRTDTGYMIMYDLRKYISPGNWKRVGEVQKTPNFRVDLVDKMGASLGAQGYYRVTTLIIPEKSIIALNDSKYASVTNEIVSTNIIGVLEVASTFTNTMAAVPWKKIEGNLLDSPKDEPITVENYVAPQSLNPDDKLQAANNGWVYRQWTVSEEKTLKPGRTITKSAMQKAPEATEFAIERNSAVWITRNTEPKKNPIFLVGQYSSKPIELTIAAGEEYVDENGKNKMADVCTLVSNPNLTDININDYNWDNNPTKDDLVSIPNGENTRLLLRWRNGSWGASVSDKKTFTTRWETNFTVKVGTGFWYHRMGPAFKITLPQDGPKE